MVIGGPCLVICKRFHKWGWFRPSRPLFGIGGLVRDMHWQIGRVLVLDGEVVMEIGSVLHCICIVELAQD